MSPRHPNPVERRSSRTAGIGLLAFFVLAPTHCHEPRHQASPTASGMETAARSEPSTPAGGELAEATLDQAADLLCEAFRDWPRLVLDDLTGADIDRRGAELIGALSPVEREHLAGARLAERAAALCPEVVRPEQVAPAGLPRPAGRLVGFPGLFDATAPASEAARLAALEWTAIGLGCASLMGGGDQALYEAESRLLERMGFTLDSYVEASLAHTEPTLGDRVFEAVLGCAQRAHGELPP